MNRKKFLEMQNKIIQLSKIEEDPATLLIYESNMTNVREQTKTPQCRKLNSRI